MSISNNALIFYHTYTIESKKKSVYFTDFSIKTSFSLEYRDGFERLLGRDWAEAWKSGKFSVEISPNLYRYSDAVRTKAIAMRLSGSTWKAIRAATGAPPATVRRWIDAHCAQTKRKPPKPEPRK